MLKNEIDVVNEKSLPILLGNPELIPAFLESDYFDSSIGEKLKKVSLLWEKTGEVISPKHASQIFNVEMEGYNKTDVDYILNELEDFRLNRFQLDMIGAQDLSWESIHKKIEKYSVPVKDQREGELNICSIEDIKILRDHINNKIERYVDSGYSEINSTVSTKSFGGGWRPGSIYTVMGLTGTGKSIFLTNFARATWERGSNVLYISTEMDEFDTSERIFKSYSNQETIENAYLQIKKFNSFPTSRLKIIKVHPNDTTTLDIQKILDEQETKPDILFIDYADELKSHERTDSEYMSQGVIYAGLKKIAEVNDIPVVTATQTNREAENKDKGGTKEYFGFSAVSDSTKKIRLVDCLFSIVQTADDKEQNNIQLVTIKNRHGENTRMDFSINYKTMRLTEGIKRTVKQTANAPKKTTTGMMTTKEEFEKALVPENIQTALDKYTEIIKKGRKRK